MHGQRNVKHIDNARLGSFIAFRNSLFGQVMHDHVFPYSISSLEYFGKISGYFRWIKDQFVAYKIGWLTAAAFYVYRNNLKLFEFYCKSTKKSRRQI